MNRFMLKAIFLMMIVMLLVPAIAVVVASAAETVTVSEPTSGISEHESIEQSKDDFVIEEHPMKKYSWVYYVIAFVSVAAVISVAVTISKKFK